MRKISKEEMCNIEGGGINALMVLGTCALIVFIIGVYDGIVRPLGCRD